MPLLQVLGTVNSACRCLGPELPTLQVDLEMVQGNLGGRRLDQKPPQTADVAGDGVGANVVLSEAVNVLPGARRARDRGGEAREGGKKR
jgi:hypothetical protein